MNLLRDTHVALREIAIKYRLGRCEMPISSGDAIGFFRRAGYQFLPVEPEHAAATETLPPHHQDPFDRLLAAQAQIEPMRLLTHDPLLVRYGDFIVAV